MARRIPCVIHAIAIAFALTSVTCYPVNQLRTLSRDELVTGRLVEAQSKVHLLDGSVILLPDGLRTSGNSILGVGVRYWVGGGNTITNAWRVPLDSVLGIEYFDSHVPNARVAASIPLVASVTAGIAAAVVGTLKALFGSCPTVYSYDGTEHRLEAECFSYSTGSIFEAPDLDRLEQNIPAVGRYVLRLRNEALETHYIDRFRLAYCDHPAGTEAFPTDDGDVLLVREPRPAPRALSSERRDVTSLLRYRDNVPYTIDTGRIAAIFRRNARDWIELTLPVSPGTEEITLALRGRNSLENTILLYDVMMRDQGADAIDWLRRLDYDILYSYRLYRWYTGVSGIDIEVERNGGFERVARISDTGPIAWKSVAATVALPAHGDSVRVRLSFNPDAWHIDWVGYDEEHFEKPELHVVDCSRARGNVPGPASPVDLIADDDGDYLVTYPGEWLDLAFQLPATNGGTRTLFIDSKGYYVEWVRPEWMRERDVVNRFDISNPELINARLAERWIERKEEFEKQFYEFRIPISDPERPL